MRSQLTTILKPGTKYQRRFEIFRLAASWSNAPGQASGGDTRAVQLRRSHSFSGRGACVTSSTDETRSP
jgi:hypothetical protein